MSNFMDILNAPLPSKMESYTEGADSDLGLGNMDSELSELEEACKTEGCKNEGCKTEACKSEGCKTEGCKSEGCRTEACKSEGCKTEGCRTEGCKTEEDDMSELEKLLAGDPETDDSADPGEENEYDSQLADLEGLMSAGSGDDDDDEKEEGSDEDIPVDPSMASSVDDPTPAPPLEGEADQDADNMMAIIATPMIINDAMTVQEAADFLESGDAEIAVSEDLLLESAMDDMIGDIFGGDQAYTESVFASPNKPFKMTKKARFNQLYELSLQIEARAHHDPFVPRIEKAYKIEREIKAGWRHRYGELAKKRAMKYLKRIMRSNSSGLKKAAKQFIGK